MTGSLVGIGPTISQGLDLLLCLSYSMIVLYIRDHAVLSFLAQKLHPKTSLKFNLAVLVRYNQAQKCLQSNPKPFQQVSMEF